MRYSDKTFAIQTPDDMEDVGDVDVQLHPLIHTLFGCLEILAHQSVLPYLCCCGFLELSDGSIEGDFG